MLPTHVFADAVQFLDLRDLDALLLTDARCSDLAHSAASKIRVFDFSDFEFYVYQNEMHIHEHTAGPIGTILEFADDTELVDFIPAALRNCLLKNLTLWNQRSSAALKEVVHTVGVKGTLLLCASAFLEVPELVKFAVSFRSVKICPSYFNGLPDPIEAGVKILIEWWRLCLYALTLTQ